MEIKSKIINLLGLNWKITVSGEAKRSGIKVRLNPNMLHMPAANQTLCQEICGRAVITLCIGFLWMYLMQKRSATKPAIWGNSIRAKPKLVFDTVDKVSCV